MIDQDRINQYYELLEKFKRNRAMAVELRELLQTMNLEEWRKQTMTTHEQAELFKILEKYTAAEPLFPPEPVLAPLPPHYVPSSIKENYHVINSKGQRCWETVKANEAARGFVHPDKGGPPFKAGHRSKCDFCGMAIEAGDPAVVRQRVKRQA